MLHGSPLSIMATLAATTRRGAAEHLPCAYWEAAVNKMSTTKTRVSVLEILGLSLPFG